MVPFRANDILIPWLVLSSWGCAPGLDGGSDAAPKAKPDHGPGSDFCATHPSHRNCAVADAPDGLTALVAGIDHACALDAGRVYCWGDNGSGQLGDGTHTASLVAREVPGITDAVQISAAAWQTCAVHASGSVSCWGDNFAGQLGDGTTLEQTLPVTVAGITNATQVATGYGHSCAVLASGSLACWGDNGAGQLGTGATGDALAPVTVGSLGSIVEVDTGSDHTCARSSGGSLWCWGSNSDGQVGVGILGGAWTTPQLVLDDTTALGLGDFHTCAVEATGSLACWGANWQGQLGNDDPFEASTAVPVSVVGIFDATDVAGGEAHTCARRATGEAACWGWNGSGQVGDVDPADTSYGDDVLHPVEVTGISSATLVTAGAQFTCAGSDDGVQCWGSNGTGTLGDGTLTDSSTPVAVQGLP